MQAVGTVSVTCRQTGRQAGTQMDRQMHTQCELTQNVMVITLVGDTPQH